MKLKQIWFFVKNPDCIWNMMVEFKGEYNEDSFEVIETIFLERFTNLKIISISKSRRLYRAGSLSFEVSIDDTGALRFYLEELEVSFRRSRELISEELGELLERLSKILKEDGSEYYFNISFKDFNPYYGYFLRRLNAKEIKTFNVKFNVENNKVTLNKKSIEIYTNSL